MRLLCYTYTYILGGAVYVCTVCQTFTSCYNAGG
jgi:hypothetical protein